MRRGVAPARDLARERGEPLYLAGGAVRDLLLGRARDIVDVDLVVESDAAGFARELARRLGARLTLHGRFGTAALALPDGGRLDVATARAEDYERPGALPRVREGTIADDLARRDFTVNAIAMEVASARRPRLLDPFKGRRDLDRRLVRMLHERSALDDPTRAFRAVRYANRLGFRIGEATRAWIRAAVERGALDAVSGDRLRRELVLLFGEPNPAAAVRGMAALDLPRAFHPALGFDASTGRALRAAERLAARRGPDAPEGWLLYLLVWMADSTPEAAAAIARRLNLPRRAAGIVRGWPELRRSVAAAATVAATGGSAPSALGRIVEGASDQAVLATAAIAPPAARKRILAAHGAPVFRLGIRGRDLLEAGVPPGPAIGRALSATLSARRDGAIRREQELAFALEAARS